MKGKGKNKKFRSQSGRPESARTKERRQDREIERTASANERDFADSRTGGDVRSRSNDPMWYAQNPQLLVDFASFPFGVPIGNRLQTGITTIDQGSIPGIMSLEFQPVIGIARSENSPVNIATRNIYSFVRHANSGHSNYDSPDLMLYILAMDSVYTMHAFMKRALGVALTSSPYNRYYQRAVLTAMGVDPDDLLTNIANFRGFVNQYAVKMGSMCIPNSMSYMARHSWMCEGLYVDSVAAKAQTYLYTPSYLWKFSLDEQGAGQLVPQSVASGVPLTTQQMILIAQGLLDPIVSNEDMNIMSGDILKAFGPEGVVKVMGIPDNYVVLPVYSQEVLSQIENATITGPTPTPITQNVAVGTGYITHDPKFNIRIYTPNLTGTGLDAAIQREFAQLFNSNVLLNMHHDGVTPAETMVASRLSNRTNKTFPTVTHDGNYTVVSLTNLECASEVLTGAKIWYFKDASMDGRVLLSTSISTALSDLTGINGGWPGYMASLKQRVILPMIQQEMFDWSPQLYPLIIQDGNDTPISYTMVGMTVDADNYTILTPDNLYNMHGAALLSEFTVPQMGAFATKL